MKNEFMKICMSSLYETYVNEFEDAFTLKLWWSLWIVENNAWSWKYVYDLSKLIYEDIYMFHEAWLHDMNDI